MQAPKLMERATQAWDHTRDAAKERAEQVKTFVRTKPFLATLLGAGAGLVLGMLLTPKVPKVQVVVRTHGKPG